MVQPCTYPWHCIIVPSNIPAQILFFISFYWPNFHDLRKVSENIAEYCKHACIFPGFFSRFSYFTIEFPFGKCFFFKIKRELPQFVFILLWLKFFILPNKPRINYQVIFLSLSKLRNFLMVVSHNLFRSRSPLRRRESPLFLSDSAYNLWRKHRESIFTHLKGFCKCKCRVEDYIYISRPDQERLRKLGLWALWQEWTCRVQRSNLWATESSRRAFTSVG